MIVGMIGLGLDFLLLEIDIPETTTNSFLYFLLRRLGHGGPLVPIRDLVISMILLFFVAVAVQWHLRWWGTPCALPPQKGRRTALPPDEPGRTFRYLVMSIKTRGGFQTSRNLQEVDDVRRKRFTYALFYGAKSTNSTFLT